VRAHVDADGSLIRRRSRRARHGSGAPPSSARISPTHGRLARCETVPGWAKPIL